MQLKLGVLQRSLLVGALTVAPIAMVVANVDLTHAVPNDDVCVTATLKSNPSIKSTQGSCPVEIPTVEPTATSTPSPAATAIVTPTSSPSPTATVTPTPTASPTATPSATPTTPPNQTVATCADVVFQANPGVTLKCEVTPSTWQDNYKITVTSDSVVPIQWNIAVDNKITKNFVRVDLDSAGPIDNMTALTRQFTVTGVDRSWNHDPLAANNYAYVSQGKTLVFTMRAIWQ